MDSGAIDSGAMRLGSLRLGSRGGGRGRGATAAAGGNEDGRNRAERDQPLGNVQRVLLLWSRAPLGYGPGTP